MDQPEIFRLAVCGFVSIGFVLALKKLLARSRGREPPEDAVRLTERDSLRLSDLYEGVFCFGATGSGKTSGPVKAIARFLMRQGAGLLILTAKRSDFEFYLKLARLCGREADVVRFGPGERSGFDPLDFELRGEGGSPESAAAMFAKLLAVSGRAKSGGDDQWWLDASERHFRNCVAAIFKVHGGCRIGDVYRFATGCPASPEEMRKPEWAKTFTGRTLLQLAVMEEDAEQDLLAEYFANEFVALSDKTRSIIHTMVIQTVSRFMTGPIAKLVSSGESLTPLDVLAGKIVVVDCPTLVYRQPGQLMQVAWKDGVQRACLRRADGIPVGIIADEAQLTVLESDTEVQAVARSHKLVHVHATQNMPLLISAMGGGDQGRMLAEALVANCQTKVFCANGCKESNAFASELCGHSRHLFASFSEPTGGYDLVSEVFGLQDEQRGNVSASEQWHPDVPPGEFTKLRKGGVQNGLVVEAYVFQGGRMFSNGKTWVKAQFHQGDE